MFVSGSNSPRRLALPAPAASRADQVQPVTPGAPSRREDRRTKGRPDRRTSRDADPAPHPAISRATSAMGVQVQADFPHPRRGLRADASERTRYARAYDSAQQGLMRQPAARGEERSA
ncbi:hypothetical protein ABWI01_06600 [Oceanicaulis alexandrii]|uniref:hypothetical protein n=1 Tax=Oceanicaulis TaxID=153232 RepID=UPI0035CEEDA3